MKKIFTFEEKILNIYFEENIIGHIPMTFFRRKRICPSLTYLSLVPRKRPVSETASMTSCIPSVGWNCRSTNFSEHVSRASTASHSQAVLLEVQ